MVPAPAAELLPGSHSCPRATAPCAALLHLLPAMPAALLRPGSSLHALRCTSFAALHAARCCPGCPSTLRPPAARSAHPWLQGRHAHPARTPLPSRLRSLPAYNKLHSLLTAVSEELPDCPLYFNLHDMCKTLRSSAPKADTFKSALVNAGYR